MIEALIIALVSAIGSGLVTWGAIRVEVRWARADAKEAKAAAAEVGRRLDVHLEHHQLERRSP